MTFVPFGGQPRPYRDFLTPSLHRRFTDASTYTLVLCYIIACWMGETNDWIWLWFPIGPAGIRTLLLFIPAITVYILRVAQWHVGARNTQSPNETFTKYLFRKATFSTVIFYTASAWLYTEIYIWTRAEKARLEFTDTGRFHERIRLNERPLYLRFMFIMLALAQAGVHLWKDYDKINIQAMKPKETATAPTTTSPSPELIRNLRGMVVKSGILATVTLAIGSIGYFAFFRYMIWDYYHGLMRYFISLSKNSRPTGLPPFLSLVGMFVSQGTLLALLWQFVNKAFDLYIAQPPLKKDKPITSDSKDPNGSLLNGLKSKKDEIKAIAFWELALITSDFPERRKTIYSELDRKKGPTFSQMTSICLAELRLLISRLNVALDPNYKPDDEQRGSEKPAPSIALVPQISQPLKDGEIKGVGEKPATKGEKFEAFTADLAKSHSSSQNVQTAYAKQWAKKGAVEAEKRGKQAESWLSEKYNMLVQSPLGYPFRQSLRRTAKLVVTGAPYSRLSLICNAITALTNLTVFSLKEDECGRFHEGIPDIVRIFTIATKKLEEYIEKAEIHWSDFETLKKPESERRKVPEVEEVRDALKDGLEKILGAFNEYLTSLGLSRIEVLEAKKVASRGPQMVEAGR